MPHGVRGAGTRSDVVVLCSQQALDLQPRFTRTMTTAQNGSTLRLGRAPSHWLYVVRSIDNH